MDEKKRIARLEKVRELREVEWAEFEDRRAAALVDMEAYAEGRYPITNRQRSFVRQFIQHWNPFRAFEEAGYRGDPYRGAPRLFKVPAIAAAIQYEQRLAAQKAGFTSEWVMKQIKELFPKFVGEEEVAVPVSFQGEITSEMVKKFHASETKSLLEMIAKSTDFFDGGSSPDKNVEVHIDMGRLGAIPQVRDAITIEHDS